MSEQLRLTHPGEVVAAIPYLLGYYPGPGDVQVISASTGRRSNVFVMNTPDVVITDEAGMDQCQGLAAHLHGQGVDAVIIISSNEAHAMMFTQLLRRDVVVVDTFITSPDDKGRPISVRSVATDESDIVPTAHPAVVMYAPFPPFASREAMHAALVAPLDDGPRDPSIVEIAQETARHVAQRSAPLQVTQIINVVAQYSSLPLPLEDRVIIEELVCDPTVRDQLLVHVVATEDEALFRALVDTARRSSGKSAVELYSLVAVAGFALKIPRFSSVGFAEQSNNRLAQLVMTCDTHEMTSDQIRGMLLSTSLADNHLPLSPASTPHVTTEFTAPDVLPQWASPHLG